MKRRKKYTFGQFFNFFFWTFLLFIAVVAWASILLK